MTESGQTTTEPVKDDVENQDSKKEETNEGVLATALMFDMKNTFWHRLCCDKRATKIISILFSTPLTISILALIVIATILNVTGVDDSQPAFYLSFKLIVAMMGSSWAAAILFYTNVEAAKLIIKTFPFWVKALSVMQAIIFHFILAYYFDFWQQGKSEYVGLSVVADVFLALGVLLTIFVFCFADGLYLRAKYKIAATALVTIGAGLYTIAVMFNAPENDDTVIHVGSVVSYSAYSGYNSAAQVLCLFLAQSAFFMIWNPKQCINILGDRPLLKWK